MTEVLFQLRCQKCCEVRWWDTLFELSQDRPKDAVVLVLRPVGTYADRIPLIQQGT